MKGRFLVPDIGESSIDRNIYADKSSVVVAWIVTKGVLRESFSLREVVLATGVGAGTVHRVFESLILRGYLQTRGVRTAKAFLVKNPTALLLDWIKNYSILKKCRMFSYSTGFQNREQLIQALLESGGLQKNVVAALHFSAEQHGCKNTNLQQLELYCMQPNMRSALEKVLKLKPKERGYDVLLIEPYYKTLLQQAMDFQKEDHKLFNSPSLITFLDLYHFPLRGIEQAEFMAERLIELKRIYKKGK